MLMMPRQTQQAQQQPQYQITDEDKVRVKGIAAAWLAYEGKLDKPLQKLAGQPDLNVLSNRCQQIVDRGIDFLFGKELEIKIGENDPEEAQTFLDDTWGRKEQRLPLLQKLAMSGALAGRAYLRIVPERSGSYRLVVVDPATVYVQTAPQDVETVLLYCLEYCVTEPGSPSSPRTTYYREEITRIDPDQDPDDGNTPFTDTDASWMIQHWSQTTTGNMGPKANAWIPAGEPIAWNYKFPPLFSCQNLPKPHDFNGYTDLRTDLIELNKSLNLIQTLIEQTEWIYGNPILYSNGIGMNVVNVEPGRVMGLGPDGSISAVSIVTDVPNALAFAANLRSDIDEQSGIPGVATGRIAELPRGNMSGLAIQLMFMPILKKTDKKRCCYGELIIDVSLALLILAGFSEDIEISLPWQDPLPEDDLASMQAALLKKQIGISNQTLMSELGYNADEETELSKTEDAQTMTNFMRGQGPPPSAQQPAQESPFIGNAPIDAGGGSAGAMR